MTIVHPLPADPSASGAAGAAACASGIVGLFIEHVRDVDRDIARLMARKAWLIDQARLWSQASVDAVVSASYSPSKRAELARRSLTAEIACGSRIPEVTADRLLDESELLVHELPATRSALAAGDISYRHAQVMVDQARSLPADARSDFESAVLPNALTSTVSQFGRRARAQRERSHPESMAERTGRAAADRHVSFEPDCDGMAWLHHYLPALDAVRIDDTLEQLARGLRDVSGTGCAEDPCAPAGCTDEGSSAVQPERRTHAQLRSDVLRDLLLRDPATGAPLALRPTVIVTVPVLTVPVLTLLGHDEAPASLDGYGPIDAETARTLCAHAPSFIRILTHPETGATLSVGRERYRPPADLRLALRLADQTCRFPGCSRRAQRCELDHTRDWHVGGATETMNLAHLCPRHHHLKHETAWSVTIDRHRALRWRSPAGKHYTTHPSLTEPTRALRTETTNRAAGPLGGAGSPSVDHESGTHDDPDSPAPF